MGRLSADGAQVLGHRRSGAEVRRRHELHRSGLPPPWGVQREVQAIPPWAQGRRPVPNSSNTYRRNKVRDVVGRLSRTLQRSADEGDVHHEVRREQLPVAVAQALSAWRECGGGRQDLGRRVLSRRNGGLPACRPVGFGEFRRPERVPRRSPTVAEYRVLQNGPYIKASFYV